MDIYTINGVEVEYDTFDLANMELYDSEVKRIAEEAAELNAVPVTDSNYLGILRDKCALIMDAFDCILGEGTSEKLFHGRLNVAVILDSYREFTSAVAARVASFGSSYAPAAAAPEAAELPMNREQRRVAERQKRREEAARRAAEKHRATV